jgi:hypothetical protein
MSGHMAFAIVLAAHVHTPSTPVGQTFWVHNIPAPQS